MKLPKYHDAEICKDQILSDNKNKSGIYMFTNKTNEKRYIGSSDNLKLRFSEYFNENYLLRNQSMAICCALLKHGYSNFSLIILEYCLITELLIREKHYQKTLKPEYNIAKEPGAPMSGRKHSDATKIIMSGRTHSDATKKIMSPSFGGMLKKEKIILIMVKLWPSE